VAGLIDLIRPKLQDGFELEFFKGGKGKGMWRLTKNGVPYREKGLKYVVINDDDNFTYRRKQLKRLEEIGAIPASQNGSKPKEREPVVRKMPTKSDLEKALELAQTIMKDPKSSPRERSIARAYIKLVRKHVHVVKTTRRLQARLGEHAHAEPVHHP
jgi:hypothetical protein